MSSFSDAIWMSGISGVEYLVFVWWNDGRLEWRMCVMHGISVCDMLACMCLWCDCVYRQLGWCHYLCAGERDGHGLPWAADSGGELSEGVWDACDEGHPYSHRQRWVVPASLCLSLTHIQPNDFLSLRRFSFCVLCFTLFSTSKNVTSTFLFLFFWGAAVPSPELVDRIRDLYHKRVPDVRFLIPVLNGLSKVGPHHWSVWHWSCRVPYLLDKMKSKLQSLSLSLFSA